MNQEKQEPSTSDAAAEKQEKMNNDKSIEIETECCVKKMENLSLQENKVDDSSVSTSKENRPEPKEEESSSKLRGFVDAAIQVESTEELNSNQSLNVNVGVELKRKKEDVSSQTCEKCGHCIKCEKCDGCVTCIDNEEKAVAAESRVLTDEYVFDNGEEEENEDEEFYDVDVEEEEEEEIDDEEGEEEDGEPLENNVETENASTNNISNTNNNSIKLEMITEDQLEALEKMVLSEKETFIMNSRVINDKDTCFTGVISKAPSYSGLEREIMDTDQFIPVYPDKIKQPECNQTTSIPVAFLSVLILALGVYVLVTSFKHTFIYKRFMGKN